MEWVIPVTCVLVAAWVLFNPNSKARQKMRGENRCAYCKHRIKRARGDYGTVCIKCGRTQPRKAKR